MGIATLSPHLLLPLEMNVAVSLSVAAREVSMWVICLVVCPMDLDNIIFLSQIRRIPICSMMGNGSMVARLALALSSMSMER